MMTPSPITVLTWDPVCRRSVSLAKQLGQPLHTVHYLLYRRPWIAPFKYVAQTIKTFIVLRQERARTILVSSPPPFSVLAVYVYCCIFGTRYVMDAHTGVFFEPKWTWLLWLTRFLSRRALFTIVTNEHLKQVVESWGASAFVLEDALPELPAGAGSLKLDPSTFNVVAVFSFYEDEPIDEMLSVKQLSPDVRIYMTGDHSRVKTKSAGRSEQLTLTGFLSEQDYASLLQPVRRRPRALHRPHTMLCGAYEAAAAGKPLVTSDWSDMRAYFRSGTVFVDNSTASIEEAIRIGRTSGGTNWRGKCARCAVRLQSAWQRKFADCVALVDARNELAQAHAYAKS